METEKSKNEKELSEIKFGEIEKNNSNEGEVQKFTLIFKSGPKTKEEIDEELEDEWEAFSRYANQRKGS